MVTIEMQERKIAGLKVKDDDLIIPEANGVNITPNGDLIIVGVMVGAQSGQGRILRTIANGYWKSSFVEDSNINIIGAPTIGRG